MICLVESRLVMTLGPVIVLSELVMAFLELQWPGESVFESTGTILLVTFKAIGWKVPLDESFGVGEKVPELVWYVWCFVFWGDADIQSWPAQSSSSLVEDLTFFEHLIEEFSPSVWTTMALWCGRVKRDWKNPVVFPRLLKSSVKEKRWM